MTRTCASPQVGAATTGHTQREPLDTGTTPVDRQMRYDLYDGESMADPTRGAIDIVSGIMSLIWFRLGLIAAVALALSSAICFYAYTQPSIFQSSALINLSPPADIPTTKDGSRSDSRNVACVASQMRVLTSSPFIVRFLENREVGDLSGCCGALQTIPDFIQHTAGHVAMTASSIMQSIAPHSGSGDGLACPDAALSGNPGDEPVGSAKARDRNYVTASFRKALIVKPATGSDRDSGMVEASFRARDPEAAQRTLQAYLDFYGLFNRERLRTDLEARRIALKEHSVRAEQALMQSERSLAEFVQAHGIMPRGNTEWAPVINLVNRSQDRMVEVREEKQRIRSKSGLTSGAAAAALGKTGEDGALAELKRQLARLEGQYAEQAAVYSHSFPKMVHLKREIDHLREKVGTATNEVVAAALESAQLEEKVREFTLDETKKEATRMNSLQGPYTRLRRKAETDAQVYQKLLSALEDVDIQWGTIPKGVNIIEPPTLSSFPVAPRRGLIIAIGIALGLVCGVAVACAAEGLASNRRVLDLHKTAVDIDTRPLGIVPDFAPVEGMGRSKRQITTSPLFEEHSTMKQVSHIMRDIETSLYFFPDREHAKTTMVSSAVACEGKTFLATSLACAMSLREGQRTIILDSDMRRPTLHKVFGHDAPGPGLSTALADRDAVLSRIIHRSRVPHLFYLTAGPVPEDPLALLRSKRFPQLLATLERYFDNIVIDTPPVLSVPDYMPLCHVVKQVILVVDQRKTLREEVRKCAESIRCVSGIHILGVILNRAQSSASRYTSATYRRSRYHYRYQERYYGRAS
jgi:polysaccharide biosynthesis transport protein